MESVQTSDEAITDNVSAYVDLVNCVRENPEAVSPEAVDLSARPPRAMR